MHLSLRDSVKAVLREQLLLNELFVDPKKYSNEDMLLEMTYLCEKDPNGLFGITFIQIPKIGINPKSLSDTPNGVYFYPIQNDKIKNQFAKGQLPYASGSKYIGFFKAADSSRIINLGDKDFCFEELMRLDQRFRLIGRNYEREGDIGLQLLHRKLRQSIDSDQAGRALWIFLRLAAKTMSKKTSINSWTLFIKALGYDGIVDYTGESIIHPNEPCQGVMLGSDTIETIKIYHNPQIYDR